jgi:hypothetical protein
MTLSDRSVGDIRTALALCGTLSNDTWRGCPSGVFMQYNIVDEIRTPRPFFKEIAASPCDTLAEKEYLPQCVNMLPSWWYVVLWSERVPLSDTFSELGRLCRSLSGELEDFQEHCFIRIGHLAAIADTSQLGTDALCAAAASSETELRVCTMWGARTMAQTDAQKAHALCETLPGRDAQYCEAIVAGPPSYYVPEARP